nr:hypothetical protein Iba_chr12dCG1550 [Ipomoea batatas]
MGRSEVVKFHGRFKLCTNGTSGFPHKHRTTPLMEGLAMGSGGASEPLTRRTSPHFPSSNFPIQPWNPRRESISLPGPKSLNLAFEGSSNIIIAGFDVSVDYLVLAFLGVDMLKAEATPYKIFCLITPFSWHQPLKADEISVAGVPIMDSSDRNSVFPLSWVVWHFPVVFGVTWCACLTPTAAWKAADVTELRRRGSLGLVVAGGGGAGGFAAPRSNEEVKLPPFDACGIFRAA